MAFQSNFLERIPPVTRSLLIVNVIMFVATLINENFMIGTFAMFYPASPLFRWWQPLTHMFMHGGWWHIFFSSRSRTCSCTAAGGTSSSICTPS